jgi:hypothetical protein
MTKSKHKTPAMSEAQRLRNEAVAQKVREAEAFQTKLFSNPKMDQAAARLRSCSLDKLLVATAEAKLAELRARPQMEELES